MTRLFLIRHAQADARGIEYPDDSLRPLINKGHKQAATLATTLKRLDIVFDRLFASPYTRALETAEPLKRQLKQGQKLETLNELTDSGYDALLYKVERLLKPQDETLALVGHEPFMSELSSYLLTGELYSANMYFRKAAILELSGNLEFGQMLLESMLTAKVYKKLINDQIV